MTENGQNPYAVTRKPQDWNKAVLAAFLMMTIGKQKKAAKAVKVDVRTLRRWQKSEFWPEACAAANDRYLANLAAEARAAVFKDAKVDGTLGLRVLQSIDPAFRDGMGSNVGIADVKRLLNDLAKCVVDRVQDNETKRLIADDWDEVFKRYGGESLE